MADTPGALQLRLLQTMVEVAAEKNSTLVLPYPVEMLRFFQSVAENAGAAASAAAPPVPAPRQQSDEVAEAGESGDGPILGPERAEA
jgi:hypothetical protein